jgi:hypothetical protein
VLGVPFLTHEQSAVAIIGSVRATLVYYSDGLGGDAAEKVYEALAEAGFNVLTQLGP